MRIQPITVLETKNKREFLFGFAKSAKFACLEDAASRWAVFSQCLTDKQRLEIETGGKQSGERHGAQYVSLFENG